MSGWHAGVVGSPVAHSLSPVLHRTAYQVLGLPDWTYHQDEVGPGGLRRHVSGLGPEWVGLSVTMPGKEEAAGLGDPCSADVELTGAANTLVRAGEGWAADNTDVHGIEATLREGGARSPARALLLGSGATARSALVAMHRLGVHEVLMQVRDRPRPETVRLAGRLGLTVHTLAPNGPAPQDPVQVAVSTLPSGATLPVPPGLALGGCTALDVAYSPWPTDWSTALTARGARVLDGALMLLHQGVRQVELMTGRPAPVEAMREALTAALRYRPVGHRR